MNVNRPGQGGQPWRPNPDRIRPSDWIRDGQRPAFDDFKGLGNLDCTRLSRVPGLEGHDSPRQTQDYTGIVAERSQRSWPEAANGILQRR